MGGAGADVELGKRVKSLSGETCSGGDAPVECLRDGTARAKKRLRSTSIAAVGVVSGMVTCSQLGNWKVPWRRQRSSRS